MVSGHDLRADQGRARHPTRPRARGRTAQPEALRPTVRGGAPREVDTLTVIARTPGALADNAPREDARHGAPRRIAGTDRFTVQAYLHGHKYARSGNAHNPTPVYSYVLLLDGRAVDSSFSERSLRSAAKAADALTTYGGQ